MPATTSLHRRGSALADPANQLAILHQSSACPTGSHQPFAERMQQAGLPPLAATGVEILQVNLGKRCNQTCAHCHVDAGPDRKEVMSRATVDACLRLLTESEIGTLDITGGAPEMHPDFEYLVQQARGFGGRVIDRCNLTILQVPRYAGLAEFLASQRVEIVASLPCYLEQNCDAQRGDGVFAQSIAALQKLNSLGYGVPDSGLSLTLVYNPVGPSLPPDQTKLEAQYREQLASRYGISFTRLFTITNMPISRFLDDLLQSQRFDEYMSKLIAAFNPQDAAGVMCRNTLSVAWDGSLYDCDFNQMLALRLAAGLPRHIDEVESLATLQQRRIVTAQHCYGCTAGAGSGCSGAIA